VKRKGRNDTDPSSNGDPSSSGDSDDIGNDDDQQRRKYKNHQGDKKTPQKRDDSSREDYSKTKIKEQSKPPISWMKPDKFDGKTSWETFICQFENCAHYNEWNDNNKAAHVRWAMTGIAAQMLWGTEGQLYKQLVRLGDRGGRGVEERFQHELRCRQSCLASSVG